MSCQKFGCNENTLTKNHLFGIIVLVVRGTREEIYEQYDYEFADLTCCVGVAGLRCDGYWSIRVSPSRWISLCAADKYFRWCIRTETQGNNNLQATNKK